MAEIDLNQLAQSVEILLKQNTELKATIEANKDNLETANLIRKVAELQKSNEALASKINDQALRTEGQIDFYHCNACGDKLAPGTRCERHPDETVVGVGLVYNPLKNSVRIGAVERR